MPDHNHITRDIKKWGAGCPACDSYWESQMVPDQLYTDEDIAWALDHFGRTEVHMGQSPRGSTLWFRGLLAHVRDERDQARQHADSMRNQWWLMAVWNAPNRAEWLQRYRFPWDKK